MKSASQRMLYRSSEGTMRLSFIGLAWIAAMSLSSCGESGQVRDLKAQVAEAQDAADEATQKVTDLDSQVDELEARIEELEANQH
jgi:TolA-binding protein